MINFSITVVQSQKRICNWEKNLDEDKP